jgi:NAD(P)-dependent dehydrogenase (short-subunit alcohol dehydrogenase family)
LFGWVDQHRGTGGIGRALSRFMASRGASVVVVGWTFRDSDVPGIEFVKADLSLMREAQRVAVLLPAEDLDLLVFTTGIMAGPEREETAEGIERDMAVSMSLLSAMCPSSHARTTLLSSYTFIDSTTPPRVESGMGITGLDVVQSARPLMKAPPQAFSL